MRASQEHMEKVRTHLLDSSAQGFREEGYAGLGINGLAKRAGMTSGAFYGHFASKSAAFHDVIVRGMQDYLDTVIQYQSEFGAQWARHFLDYYLGLAHVQDLAHSCVVPALSVDIARADRDTQIVYSTMFEKVVTQVAEGLPGKDRLMASALIALLAGSVMMVRGLTDPDLVTNTLSAARRHADIFLGGA